MVANRTERNAAIPRAIGQTLTQVAIAITPPVMRGERSRRAMAIMPSATVTASIRPSAMGPSAS